MKICNQATVFSLPWPPDPSIWYQLDVDVKRPDIIVECSKKDIPDTRLIYDTCLEWLVAWEEA